MNNPDILNSTYYTTIKTPNAMQYKRLSPTSFNIVNPFGKTVVWRCKDDLEAQDFEFLLHQLCYVRTDYVSEEFIADYKAAGMTDEYLEKLLPKQERE